jgi:serine/threonine protein kinase
MRRFGQLEGWQFMGDDSDTLRGWLSQTGRLEIDEAVRITLALARSIAHSHEPLSVHGEIKPENIVLREGQWTLDWRFAVRSAEWSEATLTDDGGIVGTPGYANPERWDGDALQPQADVYALGPGRRIRMSCQ